MSGWLIQPLDRAGKTEVLCSSPDALRILKTHAALIASSDIYPSFHHEFSHTLYFFDVRPEFVAWLNNYATATPVDLPFPSAPAAPSRRRFGISDLGLAGSMLLAMTALFFWISPMVSRADVVTGPPPAEVMALEDSVARTFLETPETKPDSISITITDTGLDSRIPPDTTSAETPPVAPPPRPDALGELKIWFLDVGQGDGIVIRLPRGEFVVVDCAAGSGEEMLDLLRSLGCTRIRAMVMSHPHVDHLGGLKDVIEAIPVEAFYDPGVPHPTAGYRRLLESVEGNVRDYIMPRTGDRIEWDPSVKVTVLSAGGDAAAGVNNASIVLRMEFGRTSVILAGDAEKEAEAGIVERFAGRIRSDILKVGHHGSRTSSSPPFLREVAPKHVVISCGTGNTYGHPAPITLRNLEAIGAAIHRTDLDGTILAVSNATVWRVEPVQ
jgi:competence protein ComEC